MVVAAQRFVIRNFRDQLRVQGHWTLLYSMYVPPILLHSIMRSCMFLPLSSTLYSLQFA